MLENFKTRIQLGNTDMQVCPLGIAGSYKLPKEGLIKAYEAGCNYFFFSTFHRPGIKEGLRLLTKEVGRENFYICAVNYQRIFPFTVDIALKRTLKQLDTDYIDVLLYGYRNSIPSQALVDRFYSLREKGLARYLGFSSHKRSIFPKAAESEKYDVMHVRYNAVNRGAEKDVFPHLPDKKPGVVIFTATKWGALLQKNPLDEKPPSAPDCYRFVLSHPRVNLVVSAPKSIPELEENLTVLDKGPMNEEELSYMRNIGDSLYKRH